jgi:glycosyltransferase involved in cell wall biosynthesis
MNTPRITALINTYNYGRFVGEAIESVLTQDVAPGEMEVVVVDDGSTDDTATQVARFGERVHYVRKENGGQASALNRGFAEARGEIFMMLDGDDLWRPGKVRRVLDEFERHPEAGMVYHPYRVWNTESNEYSDDATFAPITGYVPEQPINFLRYGSFGTCGMALRRAAAERVLPIPEGLRIYADTYLVLLMIFVAPVAAVNEHLTVYRHHGGNSTAFRGQDVERTRQRWLNYQRGVEEARAWLQRNGFDVEQPGTAAYLQRHELTAEKMGFLAEGVTRRRFLAHLQRELQVLGPLWPGRYRFYRKLLAGAAYVLGYERYMSWQESYRHAGSALRLREWFFPSAASARRAASGGAR